MKNELVIRIATTSFVLVYFSHVILYVKIHYIEPIKEINNYKKNEL
jgi:hypothetical protein